MSQTAYDNMNHNMHPQIFGMNNMNFNENNAILNQNINQLKISQNNLQQNNNQNIFNMGQNNLFPQNFNYTYYENMMMLLEMMQNNMNNININSMNNMNMNNMFMNMNMNLFNMIMNMNNMFIQNNNNMNSKEDKSPLQIIPRFDKELIFYDYSLNRDEEFNIRFDANSGLKINIIISKYKTLQDLIKLYARRIGISDNLLGTKIIFVFHAELLDINKNTLIKDLCMNHSIITVIENNFVVGGKNN